MGVSPGSNVGQKVAVFEQGARHVGKDIAGKGLANPTALMLSTSMMLRHLQLHSFSDRWVLLLLLLLLLARKLGAGLRRLTA